jgi:PEGA domain
LTELAGADYIPSAVFGGIGLMSMGRIAIRSSAIRRVAMLWTWFLLVTMFASMSANAASRKTTIQITVLDSETRSVSYDNNGVPLNCDQLTFDAYCRSTRTPQVISTLLVQEGNDPPFRVSCTIESKFSRCTPLPKGASFDARREKKGVTIYFVDDKGRAQKQFYSFADKREDKKDDKNEKVAPPATTVAAAAHPVPRASNADANAASPGPGWVQVINPEKVRCNFSSTPTGAEITVDGQYVGSTPSEISLPAGTHTVGFALPGFAEWKRELIVTSGSAPTISTVLQKIKQ